MDLQVDPPPQSRGQGHHNKARRYMRRNSSLPLPKSLVQLNVLDIQPYQKFREKHHNARLPLIAQFYHIRSHHNRTRRRKCPLRIRSVLQRQRASLTPPAPPLPWANLAHLALLTLPHLLAWTPLLAQLSHRLLRPGRHRSSTTSIIRPFKHKLESVHRRQTSEAR